MTRGLKRRTYKLTEANHVRFTVKDGIQEYSKGCTGWTRTEDKILRETSELTDEVLGRLYVRLGRPQSAIRSRYAFLKEQRRKAEAFVEKRRRFLAEQAGPKI